MTIIKLFTSVKHQKYWFPTEVWNTFKKYKKIFWVFTIFWISGFFRDFLKSPVFLANPRDSGFFSVSGFLSPGFGIFRSLGICIPGIRIFLVSGFLSPRFGIILYFGIFIPEIYAKSPGLGFFSGFCTIGISSGFFFGGWDIPTRSQFWVRPWSVMIIWIL